MMQLVKCGLVLPECFLSRQRMEQGMTCFPASKDIHERCLSSSADSHQAGENTWCQQHMRDTKDV